MDMACIPVSGVSSHGIPFPLRCHGIAAIHCDSSWLCLSSSSLNILRYLTSFLRFRSSSSSSYSLIFARHSLVFARHLAYSLYVNSGPPGLVRTKNGFFFESDIHHLLS